MDRFWPRKYAGVRGGGEVVGLWSSPASAWWSFGSGFFFFGEGYIRPAVFASLTSASDIDSGSSVEEQWEFHLTATIGSRGTQTFS